MFAELVYLAATVLSGGYVLLSVFGHTAGRHMSNDFAFILVNLPLWPIVFLAPLAIFCHRRNFWLSHDRIHGTKPAAVYAHRDPLLGIDWIIDMTKALNSNTVLQVWHRIIGQTGDTFWTGVTGNWALLTVEPENVKAMLAKRFDDWEIGGSRQKSTSMTVGPHSIFSVNGTEWIHARALARPAFARNQVADLEILDEHVDKFLQRIPRDGSIVEIQHLLYLLAMDTATDFMFGYSTNTLVEPTYECQEFCRAFDYALEEVSRLSRKGSWTSYFFLNKEFDKSMKTIRDFINVYVQKAAGDAEIKQRPYVFLNELLKTGAPQDRIRDHLLSIIVGGRDTTAGAISTMFWILARHPEVVAKAREEISVLNGKKPTWEQLKSFKYLNNIMKETLRLYPPVATNMRTACRDTVLPKGGGTDGQSPLFVPKGTACRYSTYSMQRRRDIYGPDADDFRPERWETLRTAYEYLPFSGGPRTCIGQQFALTQMSFLLVRILQTFGSFEPGDDRPMLQKLCMTTSLVNGCQLRFREAEV